MIKRDGRGGGGWVVWIGLLLPFLLCTLSADGAPDRLTIYSENDSPYYKPNNSTDENLTNAIGLSYHYRPEWAEELAPYIPLAGSFASAEYGAGFVAGHLMFTPEDITIARPQPNDHPWASFLFAGLFWQRASKNRRVQDHVQLNVGLVGPSSGGEQLQREVHGILDGKMPRGWDNQLPNEVTGNLHVRRTWRLFPGNLSPISSNLEYELLPKVGGSLGTVLREVRAGMEGRFGWELPDNFGTGRLREVEDVTGGYQRGFSTYAFGRVTGRAVQHDIFLDGTEFSDSPSVDRIPWVGELQLGVKLAYRASSWQFDLGYGQTFMTRKFEEQDDGHALGMWTLSFAAGF